MKKKIIALAVVVVLVCGAVAGTLIGCDLITTNAEKDYNQVVATIQYEGLSDTILKGELQAIYNTYGPVYMQYYGMTAEEALDTLLESLTRQSLILLKAKVALAADMGITFTSSSDITELLTYDEKRYCIQMANADFKSLWETNIEEREEEQAANEDTGEEEDTSEEEDTEELEARPVREEETPSTEYVADDSFVNDGNHKLPLFFDAWYSEQLAEVQNEIDDLNEQLAAATDDAVKAELQTKLDEARTRRSNMRSAYTDLQNTLEDSYTDYDYYLNNQYESRITAKYEELLGKDIAVTGAEVDAYIDIQISGNRETFIDDASYASAVENGSTIIDHYEKGYFNVRSILLGFSEEQQTYLTNLAAWLGSEEGVDDFRAVMALGTATLTSGIDASDPVIEEIVARWGDSGLGINISNTEYDSTTDKLADAYTARNVNYADVLAAMVKYIAQAKAEFLATAQSLMSAEDYAQNEALLAQYATNEAFTDLIYLVNDDDGMFSSDSYQVTPDGTATSYVEEYAVLARRLYKETDDAVRAEIGKMALEDYGSAMYSGTSSETAFNNDKFAEAAGTEYTIYVKDMTSTVADGRKIDAPVYTFVTADGSISFILNTYGIQIVMINGYAFDETAIDSTVTAEEDEDGHTWYILSAEYLYSTEVVVNYQLDDDFTYVLDEGGERIISSVKVEKKTLSQYFKDSLLDGKKTDNYNTAINQFVSANEENCVTRNEKVYSGLLKQLTQA